MAAAEVLAGKVADSPYTPCGDHCLRDHGAARMSHIYTQAGHEGIDLLGHLQKCDGTQEPDQDIARYRLPARRIHLGLGVTLRKGKGRLAGQAEKESHQEESSKQLFIFFHGYRHSFLCILTTTAGLR